jgi:hypothetical protein
MANLHVFAILNQTAADSGIPPNESRIQGLGISHREAARQFEIDPRTGRQDGEVLGAAELRAQEAAS